MLLHRYDFYLVSSVVEVAATDAAVVAAALSQDCRSGLWTHEGPNFTEKKFLFCDNEKTAAAGLKVVVSQLENNVLKSKVWLMFT